jgi:hypothetical protein
MALETYPIVSMIYRKQKDWSEPDRPLAGGMIPNTQPENRAVPVKTACSQHSFLPEESLVVA